jgi:hypothetical protein
MQTREIRCSTPNCKTLNRVPGYSVTRIARCGKCQAALPELPVFRAVQQANRFRRFAPAAIVPLVILIASFPNWSTVISNAGGQRASVESCTPLNLSDGAYELYGRVARIASMTIRTAPGSNYFVNLQDAGDGHPVLEFFVHGGSTVTGNVPLGSFVLKYATGTTWCGTKELVGSDTAVFKADDIFSFTREFEEDGSYSISSWTVELIQQRNGNLRTSRIERSDF